MPWSMKSVCLFVEKLLFLYFCYCQATDYTMSVLNNCVPTDKTFFLQICQPDYNRLSQL